MICCWASLFSSTPTLVCDRCIMRTFPVCDHRPPQQSVARLCVTSRTATLKRRHDLRFDTEEKLALFGSYATPGTKPLVHPDGEMDGAILTWYVLITFPLFDIRSPGSLDCRLALSSPLDHLDYLHDAADIVFWSDNIRVMWLPPPSSRGAFVGFHWQIDSYATSGWVKGQLTLSDVVACSRWARWQSRRSGQPKHHAPVQVKSNERIFCWNQYRGNVRRQDTSFWYCLDCCGWEIAHLPSRLVAGSGTGGGGHTTDVLRGRGETAAQKLLWNQTVQTRGC